MAIDFLSVRKQREKELNDFLTADLPASVGASVKEGSRLGAKVREDFLGAGQADIAGQVGQRFGLSQVTPTSAASSLKAKLQRTEQSQIADRERRESTRQMNLRFNTLFDALVMRGYDVTSANEYARQILLDEMGRKFRANESEADRAAALENESIGSDTARRGLEMEQNADLSGSIQNALLRSLLGVTGTIGAGYLLSRDGTSRTLRPGIAGQAGTRGGSALSTEFPTTFKPRRFFVNPEEEPNF